jgi:hypothetical protein
VRSGPARLLPGRDATGPISPQVRKSESCRAWAAWQTRQREPPIKV